MSAPMPPEGGDDEEFVPLEYSDYEEVLQETRQALSELRAGRTPPPVEEEFERTELADLEGTGEAAEGQIKVVAKPGGELERLELDPRALRAEPEELAAQVSAAINDALDDLRAKIGSAGASEEVNLEELGQELEELTDLAVERMDELVGELDDSIGQVRRLAASD